MSPAAYVAQTCIRQKTTRFPMDEQSLIRYSRKTVSVTLVYIF
jgi:hypothetical protein